MLASSLRDQAFTSADAAALLDRGVGGDSVLGMRLVVQLLARAAPAPDSTAESLLAHVLAYLFEREPLWEGAAPPREQLHARRPGEAFVLSDSLPPAVVAALRGRIPFITHAEWQSRDLRARAILYRLHRVRQAGEFVAVGWSYSERLSTPADAAPRHYAGGMDFVLRRTAGGWRAIRSVGWVT